MAGVFQNGVFSLGFDMDPAFSAFFTGSGSFINTSPPFGTGYYLFLSASTAQLAFATNLTTVIQGVRLRCVTLPTSGSTIIMQWQDITAGGTQVSLRVFSDGSLQFFLGTGTGTPLGSASAGGIMVANVWKYLQQKVTINASTGVVELKDGTGATLITASGLNTKNTANTFVNAMVFVSSAVQMHFDDWVMLDTTGSSPLNTYLGDVQVLGDKPSANSAVGGRNAFTPTNPQNDNHLNVGNIPANTAQYNADGTVGDFDMFRFPSLSATTVYFLNEWALLGLDAAGARTVSLDCYSGGTDSLAPAVSPPPIATPGYFNQVSVVDPHTGSAWGVAAAGSAELGLKVIS